jgi:hypothetical protein
VFLVLLLVKLNGVSSDLSYWAVFSPLVVPPALFVFTLMIGIITRVGDRWFSERFPVLDGQGNASEGTCFDVTVTLL